MMSNQSTGVNKLLLLSTILLILFGIVVVYTASSPRAVAKGLPAEFYLKAHIGKVLVAFVAMFIASKIDYGVWKKIARIVFLAGCVLTLAAILFGPSIKGAHRWIWGIQPSEVLKFGVIAMVASKLSDAGTEIKSLKCSILQPGVPLVIAAILLALQPNFSMLAMFVGIFTVMLVVAGANIKYMLETFGISVGIGGILLLIKGVIAHFKDSGEEVAENIEKSQPFYQHVIDRFNAFLNPESSDHAMQGSRALEALGNGGFFGTGIGNSAHKFGYLPEAHKDVIYSVVGEEFGFIGTMAVLVAFAILFYQGFEIARNSSTRFGKYLAVALTISLFFNFTVHVCVSTGLIPTTGQPLPFLSYGGTNLIFSGLFIGILLNISKPGTGKRISEPYMGGPRTMTYSLFGDSETTRTER